MNNKIAASATTVHSINAMIRYNGTGYHRHRLRDIQPDGAFLEMGNVRVLRKDTPIDVVFVHRQAGASNTHLLTAKVTRIENGGALLKFQDLDDQAVRALNTLR